MSSIPSPVNYRNRIIFLYCSVISRASRTPDKWNSANVHLFACKKVIHLKVLHAHIYLQIIVMSPLLVTICCCLWLLSCTFAKSSFAVSSSNVGIRDITNNERGQNRNNRNVNDSVLPDEEWKSTVTLLDKERIQNANDSIRSDEERIIISNVTDIASLPDEERTANVTETSELTPLDEGQKLYEDKWTDRPLYKKHVVRKCCAIGDIYFKFKNGSKGCANQLQDETLKNASPIVFAPDTYNVTTKRYTHFSPNRFDIAVGFNCTQTSLLGAFYLTEDGKFYSKDSPKAYSEYCLDFLNILNKTVGFTCLDRDNTKHIVDKTKTGRWLKAVGLVTSGIFCLLTFLVYTMVSGLRNIQGRIVMMELICLAVSYFGLSCITIFHDMINVLCISTAVTVQFAFLASFFWLNVMCGDLWWTFSGFRSFHGSAKQRETKKFILYSVYAWGIPSIIVWITAQAQFVRNSPFVHPKFGVESCWFGDQQALLYYFYGPVALVLACNLLMFLATTFIIVRHMKESEVLRRSGSKHHNNESDQQRFFVYLKLFIVMGVTWIMEIVSGLIKGPDIVWYPSDIGNALQGVLIFVIFICKRRVLRLLNQKLCPSKQILRQDSISKSSHSANVNNLNCSKIESKNCNTQLPMSNVQHSDTNRAHHTDFAA